MINTARRVFRYWRSVWRQAVDLTWAAMSFDMRTAIKWVLGVLVIGGGLFLLYGSDVAGRRLAIIALGLLGSLLYLAVSIIWYFFELPSRETPVSAQDRSVGRTKTIVSAALSIGVAAAFCYFSVEGAFTRLSTVVNPTAAPTATRVPTYTPTATSTPTSTTPPTGTPTPTPTSSTTPTPTPDYLPRGTCVLEGETPCYYVVGPADSLTSISFALFGENKHAGRIADLLRSIDGRYAGLTNGSVLVVPNPEHKRTLSYLQYYIGYSQCPSDVINPEQPCIYISEGEPYQLLASMFYTGGSEEIIRLIEQANDIQYDPVIRNVRPVEQFISGDLIILPKWP